MAHLGLQEHQAVQVPQVPQGHQELMVLQALQEHQVLMVGLLHIFIKQIFHPIIQAQVLVVKHT